MSNKTKLYYDATCRFCTEGADRLRPWLATRDIVTVPFKNGAEESEMKLEWTDGRIFGGAEAAIFLARQFWFTWAFAWISMLPGIRPLVHIGYGWIARNRTCFNGVCKIPTTPNPLVGWSLLAGFIVIAIEFAPVPVWLWMWMMAAALWAGFKIMNFRSEGGITQVNPLYFLWVGTDAVAFRYDRKVETPKVNRGATAFILAGFLLVFLLQPISSIQVTGWIGVLAMLCLFHFGYFALMARFWQKKDFPVEFIMQAPWAARTLGELWGPRWNRAFSDWARVQVFRPLVRKFGVARGTLAGFFASGIAHELVISLPARGGFGLPTLYFLIQAVGVLAQRKFHRLRGRAFTMAVALAPAPILFHPVFIERVFAPMMHLLTLTKP